MKPIHKINIRGSQAQRCKDDADCETAQEHRRFAQMDADKYGIPVHLHLYLGPGTGLANEKEAPFYVATPAEKIK